MCSLLVPGLCAEAPCTHPASPGWASCPFSLYCLREGEELECFPPSLLHLGDFSSHSHHCGTIWRHHHQRETSPKPAVILEQLSAQLVSFSCSKGQQGAVQTQPTFYSRAPALHQPKPQATSSVASLSHSPNAQLTPHSKIHVQRHFLLLYYRPPAYLGVW